MIDGNALEKLQNRIAELEGQNERLRSEAVKYRTLFNAFPNGITVSDAQGNILESNAVAEQLLGVHKAEHEKRAIDGPEWRIIRPDGTDMPPEEWASVMALKESRVVSGCEMGIVKPDGRTTWLNVTAAPLPLEDHGVVVTYSDISEKKYIEDGLIKSEALHREAQKTAMIGHWELDSPSGTPVWSEEIFHIFGLDPRSSEPSFIAHKDIIHHQDWDILDRSIQILSTEGTPFDIEFRILRPDGEVRWMHAKGSADRGEDDSGVRMFGTAQDVTGRKMLEEKLRESETRFRLYFENITDVVYELDHGLKLLNVSPTVEKVLGYKPEELIGRTLLEMNVLAPESVDQAVADSLRILNGERVTSTEYRFVTRDGAELWGDISGAPVYREGKLTSIISVARDVTARKQAEEELKHSEGKLSLILDSLPDMVLEVDAELKIRWANKAALDLNPDALGQTCYQAFLGNEQACTGCPSVRAFETGRIETGVMHQPEFKTAGESYWENIGVPLKDGDGGIVSILEVSRNVTERETAKLREEKLQQDLIQSHKMESVGTLAGGVAHDFNNILSIIIGNLEMMEDEIPIDSPLRDYLEEIRVAGLRARDVARKLLTFSRQDDAKKIPLDIRAVILEAMSLIRTTIPRNIEMEQKISEKVDRILGNATQISQVLINLCTNARDAVMDSGGSMTIELGNLTVDREGEAGDPSLHPGDYVRLRVGDTGSGMDEVTRARIFEPYYTTKEIGKGSGIGLAIVHGIIKEHGGNIFVASEPGQGSVFTIFFPACSSQAVSVLKASPTLPRGHERILFVDDEPAIHKLGKKSLERLGYRVQCFSSPLEALESFMADPESFDLLITDMAMPGMTGVQLASETLTIRPGMPILLCTGFSEKISEEIAREMGISSFAVKPLDRVDLAARVRQALDKAGENNRMKPPG